MSSRKYTYPLPLPRIMMFLDKDNELILKSILECSLRVKTTDQFGQQITLIEIARILYFFEMADFHILAVILFLNPEHLKL